jgi:hypothetical protein
MLKLLSTMIILIVAIPLSYGQAPVVEWELVIGADGSDNVINIFQTEDGGYILGGTTQHFGGRNQDNFFIKLNADGDTVWTKAYGDNNYSETVSEFIRTSDGGYIAIGNKTSSPYPSQHFMLKLDEDCDSIWSAIFGDPDVQKGTGGITEAYDGGFLFTGRCSIDDYGRQIIIIKTSSDGTFLWEKYYGLEGTDTGYNIIQADNNSYMVIGESPSFNGQEGNQDLFLMKTDINGDSIWTKSYGGEQEDWGVRIKQTTDGGYIAVGSSKSFSGGYYKDWYIVRTDANGDTIWTKTFGSSYEDVAQDIKELPNNMGFVVAGVIHYGQWDGCLIRLNADGDSLWAVQIGGEDYEIFNAVELTEDGGYILAGQTDSYGAGGTDIYVVKLSPDPVGINNQSSAIPKNVTLSQNFPNPFNASTTIRYKLNQTGHVTITIYDLLGKPIGTLVNVEQPAGYHQINWQADNIPSGVYFYKIQAGDYIKTRKMVLLK